MNIIQLKNKVKEVGTARAYFSKRGPGDETFYYGQLGDLKIDKDGFLYFSADCGPDKETKFYLGKATDVHAPSIIGHHSW